MIFLWTNIVLVHLVVGLQAFGLSEWALLWCLLGIVNNTYYMVRK